MSGTGPTPAEQHLGDRLAALVDGELKHDARERVLAHLATCAKCKAEAAAQRRLKSVFAQSAPPSPSEGFLARLQGLPGGPGDGDDSRGGPFGGSGRFADGFFPVIQPPGSRTDGRGGSGLGDPGLGDFGYLPAPHGSAVLPGGSTRPGFRIHEVGREQDRSAWRGRRFAFAAAGAVSLAAIALGGALQTAAGPQVSARAAGTGNTVTPLDEGRGESPGSVGRRNGGGRNTPAAAETHESSGAATTPPSVTDTTPVVSYTAPAVATGSLSGLSGLSDLSGNTLDVRLLTDASEAPLIRPTGTTPLLAQVLGRLTPSPAAPSVPSSWTSPPPSALPTPADDRLPVPSRR
ncbi:zf-HC2 domain-containing protein [Streptomyces sp. NPDC056061]|uniref:zf-HC2 domain-containing protein n=1 Tax=Streptomyces sp. NPDC056061 TaxID=3345700 RepID=UPI0035E1C34D